MKGGTPAALAIGVGYLLGRRRKLRTATIIAAGAATGGLGSLGGAALRRGVSKLGSSDALGSLGPQLGGIAETVRGDLLDAGKAAAMAAVSNRIESLSDSLHDRAAAVRDPAAAAAEAGDAVPGVRRRGRRDEPDQDGGRRRERADEADEDGGRRRERRDEAGDGGGRRRERPGRRDERAEYDEADEADEADDYEEGDADDADEEEPRPRPKRGRPARDRSPVSRPRR